VTTRTWFTLPPPRSWHRDKPDRLKNWHNITFRSSTEKEGRMLKLIFSARNQTIRQRSLESSLQFSKPKQTVHLF